MISSSRVQFEAHCVECSEVLDWEILQVSLDSIADPEHDEFESGRTTPCFGLSVNYEFDDRVQVEFHDGADYGGGSLRSLELWRTRLVAELTQGFAFDISFSVADDIFGDLCLYLGIMLRKTKFHNHSAAEQE
jgi:hypothetical protein